MKKTKLTLIEIKSKSSLNQNQKILMKNAVEYRDRGREDMSYRNTAITAIHISFPNTNDKFN